ncbi:hypothetical protein HBI55_112680 [Parastagonospora nodorum]|nr:hypothetical protein HBH93_155670 [Parastagonospora nodorum]KAH4868134.1 hypothetical protein HBH58_165300 [Parastagonospora nodorum]KAH5036938.1 hypothetical protein HBI75_080130 [Parastagonospora nodorum]KAH5056303.1 hypothetical protein HBH96_120660 [Parastagonospora nodorum]KAH5300123.1 hypothetical protein HBI11_147630 [Parastagonospora nodorum]
MRGTCPNVDLNGELVELTATDSGKYPDEPFDILRSLSYWTKFCQTCSSSFIFAELFSFSYRRRPGLREGKEAEMRDELVS